MIVKADRVYDVKLKNRSAFYWGDTPEFLVIAKNAQEAAAKASRRAGKIYRIISVNEVGQIDIW
jgi:hypothetical protein